jgi:DNA-binding SARP family transcriptional activator/TolB-like protein
MLRLRTLGALVLLDDDRPVDGPMAQRRRLALLALLATADPGIGRDRLVGCLWPDQDEARARHTLSQWLHLLRRDLPEGALLGTDELRLDPRVVPSDVATFRAALARGETEAAVSAYGGAFLDGFVLPDAPGFDRWAEGERARLRRDWREAVRVLAGRHGGDVMGAVELWRRLAGDDPTDAPTALSLMRALEAAGDRTGALAHARLHARLLADEFELAPDGAVEAYAAALRSAPPRVAAVTSPAASQNVAPPPAVPIVTAPVTNAGAPSLVDAVPVTASVSAPASPPVGRLRRRRAGWLLGLALAGCAVAGGRYATIPGAQRATLLALLTRGPGTLDPRRVVVAPLDDETRDAALGAFGEMAADWTTQELMRDAELDVVDARTAVATARIVERFPRLLRAGDRAIALARETGAGTVIAGRYYREGDSVRVYAQLTDALTGKVQRSLGPLSGGRAELSQLAQRVGRRAAGLVAASVDTSRSGAGLGLIPAPSYDAYSEVRLAWERYYRADFPGAFAHTARAAALDSTYMVPLLMQAIFHAEQREWAGVDSAVRAVTPHVSTLTRLEQAVHDMVRAQLAGDQVGELRAAEELARQAPASGESGAHAAHVAVTAGRPQAALARLATLDPERGVLLAVPFYWNWMTAALHALGRHDKELRAARRGLTLHPARNASLLNLARALGPAGDADGVRDAARKARTERWEGEAVRRRVLVEGSRELRAHGHARAGAALLAEARALFAALPGDDPATLEARAVLALEAGAWPEARTLAASLLARDSASLAGWGVLGIAAARQQDDALALRADSTLAATRIPFVQGRHALWRARLAVARGDRAGALLQLRAALAAGVPVVQGYATLTWSAREFDYAESLPHADPLLAPLWSDPDFRRLLEPRG